MNLLVEVIVRHSQVDYRSQATRESCLIVLVYKPSSLTKNYLKQTWKRPKFFEFFAPGGHSISNRH